MPILWPLPQIGPSVVLNPGTNPDPMRADTTVLPDPPPNVTRAVGLGGLRIVGSPVGLVRSGFVNVDVAQAVDSAGVAGETALVVAVWNEINGGNPITVRPPGWSTLYESGPTGTQPGVWVGACGYPAATTSATMSVGTSARWNLYSLRVAGGPSQVEALVERIAVAYTVGVAIGGTFTVPTLTPPTGGLAVHAFGLSGQVSATLPTVTGDPADTSAGAPIATAAGAAKNVALAVGWEGAGTTATRAAVGTVGGAASDTVAVTLALRAGPVTVATGSGASTETAGATDGYSSAVNSPRSYAESLSTPADTYASAVTMTRTKTESQPTGVDTITAAVASARADTESAALPYVEILGANQQSAETANPVSGTLLTNATTGRNTTLGHAGTASVRLTAQGAGLAAGRYGTTNPVTAGTRYQWGGWITRDTATALNARIGVDYEDGTGTVIRSDRSASVSVSNAAWAQALAESIAPAGATAARMVLEFDATSTQLVYFDDMTLHVPSESAGAVHSLTPVNDVENIGVTHTLPATMAWASGAWGLYASSSTGLSASAIDSILATPVIGYMMRYPIDAADANGDGTADDGWAFLVTAKSRADTVAKKFGAMTMFGSHLPGMPATPAGAQPGVAGAAAVTATSTTSHGIPVYWSDSHWGDSASPSYTGRPGDAGTDAWVPMPIVPDGSGGFVPSPAFLTYHRSIFASLASWHRSHGCRQLPISWYGRDYDELNIEYSLRQVAGYTDARWITAMQAIVDNVSDLAGYDPGTGTFLALTFAIGGAGTHNYTGYAPAIGTVVDHVRAVFGDYSEFAAIEYHSLQAAASPTDTVQTIIDHSTLFYGSQMVDTADYDWSTVLPYAEGTQVGRSPVYVQFYTGNYFNRAHGSSATPAGEGDGTTAYFNPMVRALVASLSYTIPGGVVDTVTRSTGAPRGQTETATAAATITRAQTLAGRTDTETVVTSPAVTRGGLAAARADTETTTLSQSAARTSGSPRGDPESAPAAETVTRAAQPMLRADPETARGTDTVVAIVTRLISWSDSAPAVATVTSQPVAARAVGETVPLTVTVARSAEAMPRSPVQLAPAVATVTRTVGMAPIAVTETVPATADHVVSVPVIVRLLVEPAAAVAQITVGAVSAVRGVLEQAAVDDSVVRAVATVRLYADSAGAAAVITRGPMIGPLYVTAGTGRIVDPLGRTRVRAVPVDSVAAVE